MPYPQQSPSNSSTNYSPDGTNQRASFGPTNQGPVANDASSSRLDSLAAGLKKGGELAIDALKGTISNLFFNTPDKSVYESDDDWRVRISMQPSTAALFYNSGNPIYGPLIATKGVVFPYTPQIDVSYSANYSDQGLTHSNYNSYYYTRSEVQAININADFTVQNIKEGQYLAAAIFLFKSCTKMFYGNSQLAGTPPPMVFLDGYGPHIMPHVPCVLTSFSHTMPSEVDYIGVPVGGRISDIAGKPIPSNNLGVVTRLPTFTTLRITLQPVYSKNNIARNFTLEKYSQGGLIQSPDSTTGGFI